MGSQKHKTANKIRRRRPAIAPKIPVQILTPRQTQVYQLLIQGTFPKEIAEKLGIASPTVLVHIYRGMRKLGARNRDEAIAMAVLAGYIRITKRQRKNWNSKMRNCITVES